MPMSQKLSSPLKPTTFDTVLPSDTQSPSGQESVSVRQALPPTESHNPSPERAAEAEVPRKSTPTDTLRECDTTEDDCQGHRALSWKVASNLFISFKYAWAGISYAFTSQRNFRIHVSVCALAIGLSVFLQLKSVEIAVIGITSGLVMALELVNTAIESIVDLTVKQTYHELAKIAKDCAAAAVLISAFVAVLVAGMLLLPPLLKLIMSAINS
jgi:diacylglycerol kinase (ATP)